ncbi:serine/threonine-protein kinase RsbW [Kribbella amoyensis]|uniref:Serine/threonine-protein kinase RsbW n=1 Tax=Kribbella amoyensis TaxID=996641 RepID=A0A561B7J4_9ACTN|nr:anti-sigma regulatory factor [Kribbella amoyensis]TWD74945.1 serine/threonine-protein kinase RsbW [Kribbella amoyensis]
MSSTDGPDEVRLSIPANGAYVAVPRSVVGNLAARNDFTVDAIDDLRIVVDEACAMLLPHATDGALECVFEIEPPHLTARVSATVPDGWHPDTESIGWVMLTALVESATAETENGRLTISVTATASAAEKA